MPSEQVNFPFHDVVRSAEDRIAQGWYVYQKWTCQHCRARQTMPDPNKFYAKGICEECKKLTDIIARGCNYMLTNVPPHIVQEALNESSRGRDPGIPESGEPEGHRRPKKGN